MSSQSVNPQPKVDNPDDKQPEARTPPVPEPNNVPQPTAQPASPTNQEQADKAKDDAANAASSAGAAKVADTTKVSQPVGLNQPSSPLPPQNKVPPYSDKSPVASQPSVAASQQVKAPVPVNTTLPKESLQVPSGQPTTTGTAVPPSVGETKTAEGKVDEGKVKLQDHQGVRSRAALGGPTPLAAADAPTFTAPGAPQIVTSDVDWKSPKAISDLLDQFVFIEEARGIYPFRGVCRKCGWQSYQITEAEASQMVKTHAQRHLREAH